MGWDMTWIALTAIATWVLALAILWLVKQQSRISREELQVRFQRSLEDRFDSTVLVSARKALATQFLGRTSHEDIDEDVMNFFESVGVLLRRGYLDPELAWVGFGFYAIRWWS